VKPDLIGLENAAWPVLLLDAAGTVLRANEAAVKLLGPAVEAGGAKLSAVWAPDNHLSAEKFLAQWERAPGAMVALRLKGRGGVVLQQNAWVCASVREGQRFFLIQLPPGGAAGAPPASGALSQRLECALQLARTVSLDFNNALTSILGHTSLLLGKMPPEHPWRAALVEVEKSAARAAEIASDLATFSRTEKEERTLAAGSLNQLLQRTLDCFRATLGTRPIEWSLRLERRLYAARFDEAKMQQVFLKLLENAVEALPEQGRITLQTRNLDLPEPMQDQNAHLSPGTYVCVEIEDTGCGIEPAVLPRVFEPFFTTKKEAGHRGLGLAWVYGIVTNHGGSVAVSSQPGGGTSVRVYLPADRRLVHELPENDADLRGEATVLVVDDEELLLTLAETVLGSYGYRVITAPGGQEALNRLAQGPPVDLVITDLVMPGMSGREFIEALRRRWPRLPVLRTSGYVWPVSAAEEADYLQKPFTSHDLLLKVRQILARRAMG